MWALRSCCQRILTQPSLVLRPQAAAVKQAVVPTPTLNLVPTRAASNFFTTKDQNAVWKAVTSVSNQGRQRGRAKGLMRYKNLHKGQRMGFGKARVSFPGLTEPVTDRDKKKNVVTRISDEKYETYKENLAEIQGRGGKRRSMMRNQSPLERGWAGNSAQGKHFGPPTIGAIADDDDGDGSNAFKNFDSVLLEQRILNKMDGNLGRVRSVRMLMAVGNKNGTGGFSLTRSRVGKGPVAIQKAINKAAHQLVTVPLYENRTVYHDFFSNFGRTKLMVKQKPPGHGVVAQRVIKSICKVIGIKDLEVVVDSSTYNYLHICKAFFLGLMRQRTHQELANEKRLYLVEFRAENDNFPMVVATPDNGKVRTENEIEPNEVLNFDMITHDSHLPYFRKERPKFYTKLPCWDMSLRKKRPTLHHPEQRLQMLVDYGREGSHLTDHFPECAPIEFFPREAPEGWRELRDKLKQEE